MSKLAKAIHKVYECIIQQVSLEILLDRDIEVGDPNIFCKDHAGILNMLCKADEDLSEALTEFRGLYEIYLQRKVRKGNHIQSDS